MTASEPISSPASVGRANRSIRSLVAARHEVRQRDAVGEQRGAQPAGSAGVDQLLGEDGDVDRVPAGAARLLGEADAEQPGVGRLAVQLARDLLRPLPVGQVRHDLPLGEVPRQRPQRPALVGLARRRRAARRSWPRHGRAVWASTRRDANVPSSLLSSDARKAVTRRSRAEPGPHGLHDHRRSSRPSATASPGGPPTSSLPGAAERDRDGHLGPGDLEVAGRAGPGRAADPGGVRRGRRVHRRRLPGQRGDRRGRPGRRAHALARRALGHRLAADRAARLRGTQAPLAARPVRRHLHGLVGVDRAGGRLRRIGAEDDRGARRRRVGAERQQDLHHQRADRRRLHGARARPGSAAPRRPPS